jgi:hypothetical protein
MNTKTVIRGLLLLIAFPVILFVAINWILSAYPFPQYGSWTGIQPLEAKLRKLEEFSKKGKVDAVILSSSIGDHGVSAETLSQEMSAKLGREYRAFNFSVGGSEFRTYYTLYLILRTVAKPAHLYLCHPAASALAERRGENSPDEIMAKAPIGEALNDPSRLGMSKFFWSLPIVNQSSAIRDLLLHGEYKNRKASHFDTYAINDYGDTLAYNRIAMPDTLPAAKQSRELTMQAVISNWQQKNSPDEKLRAFIADADIAAMVKLKELATGDSCRITLVAHDQPVGALSTEPSYREANKTFHAEIAKKLDIRSLYFMDHFTPRSFEIEDPVHLNIHGARRYSRLFAAALSDQKYPEAEPYNFSEQPIDTATDKTLSPWSAIVIRLKDTNAKTLEASFVQTWQTPAIPVGTNLWLTLRLPDKSDIVASGTVTSQGVVRATFESLPNESTVYILRVLEQDEDIKVAMNIPLESYKWLQE